MNKTNTRNLLFELRHDALVQPIAERLDAGRLVVHDHRGSVVRDLPFGFRVSVDMEM